MERKPYRNILVCYDGYRQVSWRTKKELKELLDEGTVDYYYEPGKETVNVGKLIGSNIMAGQNSPKVQGEEDLDS